MRVAQVEGNVALVGRLLPQHVGDLFRVREGVRENQPPPAAIDHRVPLRGLALVMRRSLAAGLQRRRASPGDAVVTPFPSVAPAPSPTLRRCRCPAPTYLTPPLATHSHRGAASY